MPTLQPAPWLAAVTLLACIAGVRLLRLSALTPSGSDRLASVDGLRGLLAMAVYFHYSYITMVYKAASQWITPRSPLYNVLGSAGVAAFFMITRSCGRI